MINIYVTASKLYDYIQCPHKVWRDIYGPQNEKIVESNPFIELLWKKGIQHEKRVVSGIGSFLDLSQGDLDERFKKTLEALKNHTPLIYQGVIKYGNLFGIPDLLELMPDGTYVPIDIKSGSAYEGEDEEQDAEGKPKLHYAVQLCLYNDVLKKLGFANHNNGQVIDIRLDKDEYNLVAPKGTRDKTTWWDNYEKIKNDVWLLLNDEIRNKPSYSGKCKLCPWYKSCKNWCQETNDLTNIFNLGRANRDRINEDLGIDNLTDLMSVDIPSVMEKKELEKKSGDKNFLFRISDNTLEKAVERARVSLITKKPVIYQPEVFPDVSYELFFDIEDDPTQEFVYLHGVYERHNQEERFLDFTAREISSAAEKAAWSDFWQYIESLPQDDYSVYYYSHHEKTTYKRMQKLYPDVISAKKLEEFFDNPNVIDLYSVIRSKTNWPLPSYSLKEIAVYLGFKWRDETPSGALSIQWFNNYIEQKDPEILKRILLYNEDDCKATMVIKDAIVNLEITERII
ncbi:MAG: TM0106 family RecB-like putative nuclease [Candidatus Berkelbacteria bacterium]